VARGHREAAKLYESLGHNRDGVLDALLPIYVSLKDEAAALQVYQELRDLGWKHDPLALRRLSLARAFPRAHWRAFRIDRFRLLSLGTWRPGKAAAQIGLTLLIGYAVAFASFRLIPAAAVLSIEQLIGAFLQAHGLWVTLLSVAVVIPLFEELLFRSLLLELYTRWVGFFGANLLQASAFAALHGDPRRLPFYSFSGSCWDA
jgi:membrane protease YdiL (CAAX protease family)